MDKHGKPTRDHVLTLATGFEIPMQQPGVHEGYGWTKDRVPDLAPFDQAKVRIKALLRGTAGRQIPVGGTGDGNCRATHSWFADSPGRTGVFLKFGGEGGSHLPELFGDVEIGGRYANRNKLGYRLKLERDGAWQINWQDTPLAQGRLPDFRADRWHHLRLELKQNRISGFIDGKQVAAVTDASGAKGMAFLASSYHPNLFDNVCVSPVPANR